jgi:hypothetical protein
MNRVKGIQQLSQDLMLSFSPVISNKPQQVIVSNESFIISTKAPVVMAQSMVAVAMNNNQLPNANRLMTVRMMDTDYEVEAFDALSPNPTSSLYEKNIIFSQPNLAVSKAVPNALQPLSQATKAKQNAPIELPSRAFDFNGADDFLDNNKTTHEEKRKKEVDDFEKQLQHLLGGQVPQKYAEKINNEENGQPLTPHVPQNTAQNIINEDKTNPHAFFEQISQARSKTQILDLGTFDANMEQLDRFDNAITKQRQNIPKQQSVPHFNQKQTPIIIPDAVTLSPIDLVDDLHQMGMKGENKLLSSPTQLAVIEEQILPPQNKEASYINCQCTISEPPVHTLDMDNDESQNSTENNAHARTS